MDTPQRASKYFGFSLIELMIVIVIIGVLASIAIPNYTTYVRKSRTAEAEANVNSIAQYEEQYYSENNRYASAGGNPSSVPRSGVNGGVLPFDSTNAQWSELGTIFTNNTQVRFQYRAFAGQFTANGSDASGSGFYTYTGSFGLDTSTDGVDTCSTLPEGSAQYFGITQTAYANWFVITAVANQKPNDSTCSLFAKVNDRPAVSSMNVTD